MRGCKSRDRADDDLETRQQGHVLPVDLRDLKLHGRDFELSSPNTWLEAKNTLVGRGYVYWAEAFLVSIMS